MSSDEKLMVTTVALAGILASFGATPEQADAVHEQVRAKPWLMSQCADTPSAVMQLVRDTLNTVIEEQR